MAHATKRALSSRDQEWGRETFRRYWWAEKVNLGEDSTEEGRGQRAEGKGQRAEGRGLRAEGERAQKVEG